MKTWVTPIVEELDIVETAQGKSIKPNFDAFRVDENGNLWASFES